LRITAEEGIDLMAESLEKMGSVLGTAVLVKPDIYNVTATSTKNTKASAIDAAELREILKRDPAMGVAVMTQLARPYCHRLNTTRMAITNLFKIFKFQVDKSKAFDTYGGL
jgi:hypothetical protein